MPLDCTEPDTRPASADRPRVDSHASATRVLVGISLLAASAITPNVVVAYVGPGLGLGAIGSALSLLGAIFLGILGFLWYPVKRLLRMFRRVKDSDE